MGRGEAEAEAEAGLGSCWATYQASAGQSKGPCAKERRKPPGHQNRMAPWGNSRMAKGKSGGRKQENCGGGGRYWMSCSH